jgi:thiol-disulfide isomerase/thioredoxin
MAAVKLSNKTMMYALAGIVALVVLYYAFTLVRGASGEGFASGDGKTTFTMYYADWCPHCKTVKKPFSDFAGQGAKNINGKPIFISMIEEKEVDKANAPKIDGYPTFILQKSDGTSMTYEGERTVDGWESFLKEMVK